MQNLSHKEVQDILALDVFGTAERIGIPTTDEEAMLALSFSIGHLKNWTMESVGDTTFTMDIKPYLAIAAAIGFEVVYTEKFTRDGDNHQEALYVLAHRMGPILVVDTYTRTHNNTIGRNGAKLYYAWTPNDKNQSYRYRESGGWESASNPNWRHDPKYFNKGQQPDDLVWVGYHDARQGLASIMEGLHTNGKFHKWPAPRATEFPILVTNDDCRLEGRHEEIMARICAISRKRADALPSWVRESLNGNS